MKNVVVNGLILSSLLLLPGCNWFGSSSDKGTQGKKTGEYFIKLGGETVATTEDFNNFFELYKQAQNQEMQMRMPGLDFEVLLAQLPAEQKRGIYGQIADMQVNNALVSQYIADQGWNKTPEYQENARRMYEEVDRNLALLEFQKRLLADISELTDKDLEAFYKEKRLHLQRDPSLVAQPEGVHAVAVKAKDEAQAKKLVTSAQIRGLKKAAAELGLTADDLGVVTVQTQKPDRVVVAKIMSAHKFPNVEAVQSGSTWWVIETISKKEAELVPLEKVKDRIKQYATNELFGKMYQDKLNQLKNQYNVELNQKFIDDLVGPSQVVDMSAAQALAEQSASEKQ